MEKLVIHPTVLLTVVDHFGHDKSDRVVGVILGRHIDEELHVETCFALPYKENDAEWYLDTSYLRSMFALFRKIHEYEIIGWYHTGHESPANREIMGFFQTICPDPLLLIIDVREDGPREYPVRAYRFRNNEFMHVASTIEAEEAEEVGVEHLLSDIRDEAEGHLRDEISAIKGALDVYARGLQKISRYLKMVVRGEVTPNEEILDEIQLLLNSRPRLGKPSDNDNLKTIYLSCVAKNIVKLNDIRNEQLDEETTVN